MASLDFEVEKQNFREFYNDNHDLLERAKDSFVSIIKSILAGEIETSQVIGRVKDREESIKKFSRKYQSDLEEKREEYEIKNHITDIVGLRVVCLYEKEINKIEEILEREFQLMDVTNKIEKVESSEDSFGYKGLHLDLKLKNPRSEMIEYSNYKDIEFEVQIRTIIQDAWSVLDHKIKYKKSIPHNLKRRINVLAALFELADREFFDIRENTIRLTEEEKQKIDSPASDTLVNVFSFLGIIEKEFPDYIFQSFKVDGFVEQINSYGGITPSELKNAIEQNKAKVDQFKDKLGEDGSVKHALNPYTVIRHILYLSDKEKYKRVLYDHQRKAFDSWLSDS